MHGACHRWKTAAYLNLRVKEVAWTWPLACGITYTELYGYAITLGEGQRFDQGWGGQYPYRDSESEGVENNREIIEPRTDQRDYLRYDFRPKCAERAR